MSQSFADAAAFLITSGSHRGPIGIIAVREEGLLWLDHRFKHSNNMDEMDALETYLSNETIRAELERLQKERT